MKFSIITATKNVENQIKNTIQSVISQKGISLEHIIVDAVSTDNTMDIIEKYRESYSIKFISEPDEGIADAFNKGIKLSSGEWIIFLGAGDTFIHNKVLSDISKILINNSYGLLFLLLNAGIVYVAFLVTTFVPLNVYIFFGILLWLLL